MVEILPQQVRLKDMLLQMLSWFHDFCSTQGLRYYALGGTMLGAVRHGGFIPWDDDVDIGMPRRDYERLAWLMAQYPQDRYVLEMPETALAGGVYPIAKLYDTRTTLVENTREKVRRGIYLDIFPLDGAGDTKEEALAHFSAIRWRRKLLLSMVTGFRRGRRLDKNLVVMLFRLIPGRILPRDHLFQDLNRLCKEKTFEDTLWVGNMMGQWMERELMMGSVLGEPRLYPFENLWIYGPEQAEEYLTCLYGDWRQLPPPGERVSHHDFLQLDLEHSYLQWEETQ